MISCRCSVLPYAAELSKLINIFLARVPYRNRNAKDVG